MDSVKTNITKIYIPSWVVRRTEYLKFLGDSPHIVIIQDKFPRLVLLQQLHIDACLVLVPFSHRVERFGFSVKFYKMCHNAHNQYWPVISTFLSCAAESYDLLLKRAEAAVDALNLFLLMRTNSEKSRLQANTGEERIEFFCALKFKF